MISDSKNPVDRFFVGTVPAARTSTPAPNAVSTPNSINDLPTGLHRSISRVLDTLAGRSVTTSRTDGIEFVCASALVTLEGAVKLLPGESAAELRCDYHLPKPLAPIDSLNLMPVIAAFNDADPLLEWSILGDFLEIRAKAVSRLEPDNWVPEFVADVLPFAILCSTFLTMARDGTWSPVEAGQQYSDMLSRRRDSLVALKRPLGLGIDPGLAERN